MAVRRLLLLVLLAASSHSIAPAGNPAGPAPAEAVVGGTARLPCDIRTSPGDEIAVVSWIRVGRTLPILTYDARRGGAVKGKDAAARERLKKQASFRDRQVPASLLIQDVVAEDEGLYRCNVLFLTSPTKTSDVNLTVITPPTKLFIANVKGVPIVNGVIGPFREGSKGQVVCVAEGGRPPPRVTWWLDHALVDESFDLAQGVQGQVRNAMVLERLERHMLNWTYTCQASNTLLRAPTSVSARLDLRLAPSSVTILDKRRTFPANRQAEIACRVEGARPTPTVTWSKGTETLTNTRVQVGTGMVMTSIVTFIPSPEDGGQVIRCRVGRERILTDETRLVVTYKPIVRVSVSNVTNMGDDGVAVSVDEGRKLVMKCHARANPPVSKINWRRGEGFLKEGTPLVEVNNETLTLLSVRKSDDGNFFCSAVNEKGVTDSSPVTLDVRFPPKCREGSFETQARPGERVRVNCPVDKYRQDHIEYSWSFRPRASDSPVLVSSSGNGTTTANPFDEGSASDLVFAVQEYGTVLCWPVGLLGRALRPCAVDVVPTRRPDPPSRCSVVQDTVGRPASTVQPVQTLLVRCSDEGYPGAPAAAPRLFVAEVRDGYGNVLAKLESRTTSWRLDGIPSSKDFVVVVFSVNAEGASTENELAQIASSTQTEGRLDVEPTLWTTSHTCLAALIALGLALVSCLVLTARGRDRKQCGHRRAAAREGIGREGSDGQAQPLRPEEEPSTDDCGTGSDEPDSQAADVFPSILSVSVGNRHSGDRKQRRALSNHSSLLDSSSRLPQQADRHQQPLLTDPRVFTSELHRDQTL